MTAVAAPSLLVSSAPGRWVLAVTVLGSGIASLDATVVNVALPSIGRQFHAGVGTLQWVMTGYTLTLAAFLLIGGTLGDRFGRRRVYLTGVAWFALASAACGFAPDALALIITRALQGAGAALLTPGSLAILEASFAPADRSRAIGAWSGLSGVATAAGPLLGGYLITAASWRWIFGLGMAITVAPLTATAMSSAPAEHSGLAWAVNNDVARLGGLLAIAILPALAGITGTAYLHPQALAAGFRTAVLISAAVCAVGGLLAAVTITNPPRSPLPAIAAPQPPEYLHCGLEAPPLAARPATSLAPGDQRGSRRTWPSAEKLRSFR